MLHADISYLACRRAEVCHHTRINIILNVFEIRILILVVCLATKIVRDIKIGKKILII